MQRGATDIGECFANITGMFEDGHGIAVEGQAHGLSRDEHLAFVQLLHRHIESMREYALQIECAL